MRIFMSPWGEMQTLKRIADGIDSVTTASHGGYRLSRGRWRALQCELPDWQGYAGGFSGGFGWLEEDCDWSVAVVLWSDEFSARNVFYAVKTVEGMSKDGGYFTRVAAWLASEKGDMARLIAARFAEREPSLVEAMTLTKLC